MRYVAHTIIYHTTISGACTIAETRGFLRNVCQQDANFEIIECFDNSKYYIYFPRKQLASNTEGVTKLCSDDPRLYQACTDQLNIAPGIEFENSSGIKVMPFCAAVFSETIRAVTLRISTLDKGMPLKIAIAKSTTACNGLCEDRGNCLDEALCNGYRYGMFCENITSNMTYYIKTDQICDGRLDCDSGEDEIGCSVYNHNMIDLYAGKNGVFNITPLVHNIIIYKDYKGNFSNQKLYKDVKKSKQCIPEWKRREYTPHPLSYLRLSNFTRCSALTLYGGLLRFLDEQISIKAKYVDYNPYAPYCKFYMDQTNCTDPMRGVVSCMIDGYPSTVSKFATCVQKPGLCDDGFDSLCLTITRSCNVHKHLFCNGISDCSDKSDETSKICDRMTLSTCFRRYRHDTKLPIPISWLMDGSKDCIKGEDETNIWPT